MFVLPHHALCGASQRAAERGFIDDIISPRDTRRRLCADLQLLKTKKYEGHKKKHGNIPL